MTRHRETEDADLTQTTSRFRGTCRLIPTVLLRMYVEASRRLGARPHVGGSRRRRVRRRPRSDCTIKEIYGNRGVGVDRARRGHLDGSGHTLTLGEGAVRDRRARRLLPNDDLQVARGVVDVCDAGERRIGPAHRRGARKRKCMRPIRGSVASRTSSMS